jgi:hypothetical protein
MEEYADDLRCGTWPPRWMHPSSGWGGTQKGMEAWAPKISNVSPFHTTYYIYMLPWSINKQLSPKFCYLRTELHAVCTTTHVSYSQLWKPSIWRSITLLFPFPVQQYDTPNETVFGGTNGELWPTFSIHESGVAQGIQWARWPQNAML